MRSKLIKAVIACMVIAGLGAGGYFIYNKYFTKNVTVTSSKYYTVSVTKKDLSNTISGSGSAYAGTSKDVAPNNIGTLSGLSVKVGDTVTAGQTLFTSSSDDLSKAVTTAQNNLTKANLSLSSDESADNVDSNKVATDKIAVSDAETNLASAQSALAKMTVTAPISGVVTAVNSTNGDTVSSGTTVLTIVDMNSMKIKVSVDETDISKVKTGQTATIKFSALSDKSFQGTVESIAETGTTSNSVTTYAVVVGVTNPSGIKLGMNATVTIAVESKTNALVIPAEALVESNNKKYVKVEAAGSTTSGQSSNSNSNSGRSKQSASSNNFKLVEIKTGIETTDYIEVTSGVTEGEKIIVSLPSSSSSSSSKSGRNGMGGMSGGMGGMSGGMGGGPSGRSGGGPSSGGPGGN